MSSAAPDHRPPVSEEAPFEHAPATRRVVTSLPADRIRDAALALVASHADYPAFTAVFPNRSRRRRALRHFFEATLQDAVRHGSVDVLLDTDQVHAVAVWLPPGRFPWTARRKLRASAALARSAAADARRFPRFARIGANTEARHPTEPSWYLVVLGVRPTSQRSGMGGTLVDIGLERVDRQGGACHLHTSDPANVPFYERYGFTVTDPSVPLVPAGPTHVAMRRPEGGQ